MRLCEPYGPAVGNARESRRRDRERARLPFLSLQFYITLPDRWLLLVVLNSSWQEPRGYIGGGEGGGGGRDDRLSPFLRTQLPPLLCILLYS